MLFGAVFLSKNLSPVLLRERGGGCREGVASIG